MFMAVWLLQVDEDIYNTLLYFDFRAMDTLPFANFVGTEKITTLEVWVSLVSKATLLQQSNLLVK